MLRKFTSVVLASRKVEGNLRSESSSAAVCEAIADSVWPVAGTSRSRAPLREATAPTTSADSSRKRSNRGWSRTISAAVAAVCESAGLRSCSAALNSCGAWPPLVRLRPRIAARRSPSVPGSSEFSTSSRSTSDWALSAPISPPFLIFGPFLGPGVSVT